MKKIRESGRLKLQATLRSAKPAIGKKKLTQQFLQQMNLNNKK